MATLGRLAEGTPLAPELAQAGSVWRQHHTARPLITLGCLLTLPADSLPRRKCSIEEEHTQHCSTEEQAREETLQA